MASVFYYHGLAELAGSADWTADTIKVALLMSNTTAGSDTNAQYVTDIGTLDECDDTGGYGRVTLSTVSIERDSANARAEGQADDISFTSLNGDASRDYVGVLIYKEVTDDTDSPVLNYVQFDTSVTASATQVDVPWDAEGIWQLS